jgi:hypothetical protein
MNNYDIMKAYVENTPGISKQLAADLLRQAQLDDQVREAKAEAEAELLKEIFKS